MARRGLLPQEDGVDEDETCTPERDLLDAAGELNPKLLRVQKGWTAIPKVSWTKVIDDRQDMAIARGSESVCWSACLRRTTYE
jgi:hypothetical protein